MKAKLSAQYLNAGIDLREKPYEIVDSELTGLILRVQPTGVMSYYLVYRTSSGVKKRYRLGRHGAITASQARDLAKQYMAKALGGQDLQEEKKKAYLHKEQMKNRSLKAFIEHQYAPWVQTERKTGVDTIKRLRSNFSELMNLSLDEITPWHLEKWRSGQRKRNKASSTMNRDVVTLKSVLSKAVAWGFLEIHPLAKLKPLKIDNSAKVRYLSDDEEQRLIQSLIDRDNKRKTRRDSGNIWRATRGYQLLPTYDIHNFIDYLTPMVLLALHTGLRRGELFGLSWDLVDFNKATITVVGKLTKNGKTRHVPLNSEALSVLKTWYHQNINEELVFPNKSGEQFNNVRKAWKNILKDAGIRNFRWHDMRHHFASKLVMNGVDLNTIRELLGHSDLAVTLRYAHLAPEYKAEAVSRLVKEPKILQALKKTRQENYYV